MSPVAWLRDGKLMLLTAVSAAGREASENEKYIHGRHRRFGSIHFCR